MPKEHQVVDASELVADCYTNLSRYVASTRAYCSLVDGLKAVYRRTIYASKDYKKLVKSASIVGDGIKYHPHGDGNIYGALVSMTCRFGRFPLYTGKGNFGGLGEFAAAMRYTESTLNDIARLMYLDLLDYAEFVDGEAGYSEPKYLPALLPYSLLVGSGGIPVGLPGAEIPTVDALQLIKYYKDVLKGETPVTPLPDFGNVFIDQTEESARHVIESGHGKLYFRGVIIQEDENRFVITEGTPTKGIHNILNRLKWYIDNEHVDYTDESADSPRYVFEIVNSSQISPEQLKDEIDKALRCSVTYKYIFADEESNVVYCGLRHIVDTSIKYLKECTVRKFTNMRDKTRKLIDVLKAIEDLKKSGYLSEITKVSSEELSRYIVEELNYPIEIAREVLKKPISYLTRSHLNEIDELLLTSLTHRTSPIDKSQDYLLSGRSSQQLLITHLSHLSEI